MNIDERLVTLRKSLELRAAVQRDGERRFQEQFDWFQEQFDKVTEQFSQHELFFVQVALRLREVTNSIDSLARIAGVHYTRKGSTATSKSCGI